MDDKDLRLMEIVKEYTQNDKRRFKNPNDMSKQELRQLMSEVIDYGIRMGYLKEKEKTDDGCIFEVIN